MLENFWSISKSGYKQTNDQETAETCILKKYFIYNSYFKNNPLEDNRLLTWMWFLRNRSWGNLPR